ncbi:type II toxin-antitoxin system RelE/ParE family toxin [Labrys monachus]|uniref:Plasmid stabilization system protein ParE n=1 Tax=Labrys monachus TaxID=217067 RepID=A0ABU0FDW1_9HYPH|nr:type II toxin-antitoxin system RelE/ParE family toxin [Labrys monachus]MDQ0392507.1 plasmid stabilization system protein ParE [Labrys monachus]
MRGLFYTLQAQADLEDIFDFIATDNPLRARTYIDEIRQACRNLCDAPMIGTERPDLRPGLRILPFGVASSSPTNCRQTGSTYWGFFRRPGL